jgi:redox-sensitive bicupin YhaK (pirin superfamily)
MIRVHRAEGPGHKRDVETFSRVLAAVLAHQDSAGTVPALHRRQARRYFALLVSRGRRDESLQVGEDVNLWMACIDPGEVRAVPLRSGRRAWIYAVRGSISVNGSRLAEGDGASASDEETLTLVGRDQAEILLLDMVLGRDSGMSSRWSYE